MANPGQTNSSPLFGVLPVELRLQIYEELFAGSKASYKKKHTIGSRTELNILLPSDHYNFLLTCRQAYNEALMTYWSQTTLYGDPDDDDLVYFLASVVPDFAKPRIKHIRGLNSCDLPDRPVEGCLKDYQRLQTIGFEEQWFINVASLGDHGASPTMQDWAEEHCLGQSSWKFSKLVCEGGPAVVFRGVYSVAIGVCSLDFLEQKFPDIVEDYQNQHKICFYNCSTDYGIFGDDAIYQKDQEAGFAKVLEGVEPEQEDCGEGSDEHVSGQHGYS